MHRVQITESPSPRRPSTLSLIRVQKGHSEELSGMSNRVQLLRGGIIGG